MRVSTFIAKRFMLGGRGAAASRFTGWIAIIGMAVGCFALILSIAVLNGFEERVTQKIAGFEGDLRLTNIPLVYQTDTLFKVLLKEPNVVEIMPFMERKGLISGPNETHRMVTFKAVDFNLLPSFYNLGLEELQTDDNEFPVLIGRLLADRLNLRVGDEVKLLSPIDSPIQLGFPRQYRGDVIGIFQAEVLDFDDRLVFIPLDIGHKLFLRKQGLDGIDVRLVSPDKTTDVQIRLETFLPSGVKVESWADLHQGLFHAMRMERIGAIIILSLIIMVASFNLASTLVLVTYQKIREIGILRTLGAPTSLIHAIIMKQGVMIGGAGAFVGLTVSIILVLIQNRYGILPLPEDIYFINQLPMILKTVDVILVPSIALILIILASVMAARRAIKVEPKEAVHLEK